MYVTIARSSFQRSNKVHLSGAARLRGVFKGALTIASLRSGSHLRIFKAIIAFEYERCLSESQAVYHDEYTMNELCQCRHATSSVANIISTREPSKTPRVFLISCN